APATRAPYWLGAERPKRSRWPSPTTTSRSSSSMRIPVASRNLLQPWTQKPPAPEVDIGRHLRLISDPSCREDRNGRDADGQRPFLVRIVGACGASTRPRRRPDRARRLRRRRGGPSGTGDLFRILPSAS